MNKMTKFVIIPLLLILTILASYYLGTKKDNFIKKTTNNTINFIEYKYPKALYSLKYSPALKGNLDESYKSIEPDYKNFIILSNDYQLVEDESAIGSFKGSRITITVENNSKTIDTIFKNNALISSCPQCVQDKIETIVAGAKAIQYKLQYEGPASTITEFVKNGKHYQIIFTELNSKESNWNNYLDIIQSFKTN